MRIFLDANVLFSAANAKSNIARLIDIVCQDHVAVSCDLAVEEAHRNIKLKRPTWGSEFLVLRDRLEIVAASLFDISFEIEAKDKPIICSAIASRSELLVTGDRHHFGHLYDLCIEGVTVVSILGLASRVVLPNN
jgi:predicted nucleic acid-binding protein